MANLANLKMTKQEAERFVADTFDDDEIDDNELEDAFAALYGRPVDAGDRRDGLWTLVCQAVTDRCSCCTRSEHQQGGCGEGKDEL